MSGPRDSENVLCGELYDCCHLSATRINTVLVRYGYSVRTKQYTKNPNAKYAVKAEILI